MLAEARFALSPYSGHSTSITRETPNTRLKNYLHCVYTGTIMALTWNNQTFNLSVTLKYLLKILKYKLHEKVRL